MRVDPFTGCRAFRFPPGFLWGAATSAHQVEGQNVTADWWAWESEPGHIAGGARSGAACEHYRRFAEDFDLARALGHTAHRFSIEWARVEPEPGRWSETALDHYREVLQALRDRALTPIVTLHHFTLPQWVAARGALGNPAIGEWFGRYAGHVVQQLGHLAQYWITVNEPLIWLYLGYLTGQWPPQQRADLRGARRLFRHLIGMHQAAYRAIHQAARAAQLPHPPQVSIAKHLRVFDPARPWAPWDHAAAAALDQLFNHAYVRAVRGELDWLGVNYYSRDLVRFASSGPGDLWTRRGLKPGAEQSDMGWEIYPAGLERVLLACRGYGLPILVTENGLADATDSRRARFIFSHLQAVRRALEAGVDVRGYLYWSLLDNFEWDHGWAPRFGLVAVDYATQRRQPRPSARWFAGVCRSSVLPGVLDPSGAS